MRCPTAAMVLLLALAGTALAARPEPGRGRRRGGPWPGEAGVTGMNAVGPPGLQ